MAKQGSRYGRSRARRRLGLGVILALIAALILVALLLPVLRGAPDAVRQAIYPLRHEETIREAARRNGLEPAFVAGVIHTESRFRPGARSPQGAYGLMQMLPTTAEFVQQRSGIRGDFRDPETNIRLGSWYLGYLQDRYRGDRRLMLAAYNSGEGTVDGWISNEGFDIAEDIPYEETRNYVDNSLRARRTYRDLYGANLSRDAGWSLPDV